MYSYKYRSSVFCHYGLEAERNLHLSYHSAGNWSGPNKPAQFHEVHINVYVAMYRTRTHVWNTAHVRVRLRSLEGNGVAEREMRSSVGL